VLGCKAGWPRRGEGGGTTDTAAAGSSHVVTAGVTAEDAGLVGATVVVVAGEGVVMGGTARGRSGGAEGSG